MKFFQRRAEVRGSGPAVGGDRSFINTGVVIGDVHLDPASAGSRARGRLADLVSRQWEREAVDCLQLAHPDAIAVRWHTVRDRRLMDSVRNLTASSLKLRFTGLELEPLLAEFRTMRRRRLVIIGGPGSGKTTLALQLVRQLLKNRTEDSPDEPIPVLFSVAGWDTTAFERLNDWVAHRLTRDYPALAPKNTLRTICRNLVEQRHVLPVLDGLDELPPPARTAVVEALSRSCAEDAQLILTCRTDEYRQAVQKPGKPFTSALVIEPNSVSPTAAADYLDRCLHVEREPSWDRVLEALRTTRPLDGPIAVLAEVAASPLGLWLVRTAYERSDPAELLASDRFQDADGLRTHLFDALIPAVVQHRGPRDDSFERAAPRRRHDPADVKHWLSYLASLTPESPDLPWWRLARGANVLTPIVCLCFGMITAVISGLLLAGAFLILYPSGNYLGSVLFGAATGGAGGMAAHSWADSTPGYARPRLRGRWALAGAALDNIVNGLLVGIPTGYFLYLVGARPHYALVGVILTAALLNGVTSGFMDWVETPSPDDGPLTPLDHFQADRRLEVLRTWVFALAYGPALAVGFSLLRGVAVGLAAGIIGGLSIAFTTGTLQGRHHAWLAFSAATYRLSRQGHLPRPLMPFLDDAHRLGLLRAVGPVYQFRHQALRHYLRSLQPSDQRSRQVEQGSGSGDRARARTSR
ncbi:NACHT domain-containing protein [Streptomyces collinus]|uniref:NACHT domain-containing protein n=1 Tax=Streptomyces collinus TaxID=42684 RepID=UPI00381FDF84